MSSSGSMIVWDLLYKLSVCREAGRARVLSVHGTINKYRTRIIETCTQQSADLGQACLQRPLLWCLIEWTQPQFDPDSAASRWKCKTSINRCYSHCNHQSPLSMLPKMSTHNIMQFLAAECKISHGKTLTPTHRPIPLSLGEDNKL